VSQDEPQPGGVLKKVYFIKRAKPGEELTTLLKNKFKAIDAIRDLIAWFEEGKDFVVTLTDYAPPDPASARERKVPISPWIPQAENHKNLVDAIGSIIYWLDTGRDFDITLTPTDKFKANLN
jgi:hypothetical protein